MSNPEYVTRLSHPDKGVLCYGCHYSYRASQMRAMIMVNNIAEFVCDVCMEGIDAYLASSVHKHKTFSAMQALMKRDDDIADEAGRLAFEQAEYQRTGIQH